MSCGELRNRIHGYLDGELDLSRSLEIEQHIGNCPDCEKTYADNVSLRQAIAEGGLYYEAPKRLLPRIRSAVQHASRAEAGPWLMRWGWKPLWALLGAAALVVLFLFTSHSNPAAEDLIAQQALSAHLRSLLPGHLVDVFSSDQHTVKPWFNGKLDFSPPVRDLAAQGFPLIGGRLDYIGGQPVAAVVYQRRKHWINLFMRPAAPPGNAVEKSFQEQGYNLIRWTQSGMTYWAISDVNVSELRQFVKLAGG